MKKINFLFLLILPFIGFSQTYNFDDTNDGWNVIRFFTSSNESTYMTLTTKPTNASSKNPYFGITTASVNTANVRYMGVTLRNNDATGPDYLRASYVKDDGINRYQVSQQITTSDSAFKTYWFDLQNTTHWNGIKTDFRLQFKTYDGSTGGDNYNVPGDSNKISIDIDKIEFVASLPTTNKHTYTFDSNTDGWDTCNNCNVSAVSDGGVGALQIELTHIAGSNSSISLDPLLSVDADANKFMHIRVKNGSNDNKLKLFWGPNKTRTITISTAEDNYIDYHFDLTSKAEWTGVQSNLELIVLSDDDTQAGANALLLIDYIKFDNIVTWNGNTNTNWKTTNNWDTKVVPTENMTVVIPDVANAPVINASTNANIGSLEITEPDGLNISSGGTLIVNGTSSGNVTYNRTLEDNTKWYLMSAPVAGVTFNDSFVSSNNIASGQDDNRGVATYNTANNNWTYLQAGGSISSTAGVGYSIKQSTAGNIAFTGTINTSDVSVGVSTGGSGSFNLIGNPYTASINSGTFLTDNTANLVSQTLWVWDAENSNYQTKISADSFKITPGQGFFVRSSNGANLSIAKSYQTTGGTFQKNDRTEVKLLMSDGNSDRFAKLYYVNNATTGFDNGWDGETFTGQSSDLDIYTHLVSGSQGANYQVQSLPLSDMENLVVPIGVTADAEKQITFTAEAMNLASGIKVFLEDRETNTFTRLDDANNEYRITLKQDLDGIGRFYLHTVTNVLSTSEVELVNVSIYNTNENNLRIVGISEGKTSIKIFNIIGKLMMQSNFSSTGVSDITLPKLSQGVYIVQLNTQNGKMNKKIIIE